MSGIPQGPVLVLLLFNIFITDILKCTDVKYLFFADDLKSLSSISTNAERIDHNIVRKKIGVA